MKPADSFILVTGAAGGIGAAVCRELALRGASLVLGGRSGDELLALETELRALGARTSRLVADLVEEDPARTAQRAIAAFGSLDMVINCVGVQTFGLAADEAAGDTRRMFLANTVAPIQLCNALLPHMTGRGNGHIVLIGSIFGSIAFPCFASYSSSKFALRGYAEALRRELAGSGVRVSYVAPRYTRTAFNRDAVARMAEALKMNTDSPEAVARSIVAAIEADAADTYLGWPEKLFVRINALLPRAVDRALIPQVRRMVGFTRRAESGPA